MPAARRLRCRGGTKAAGTEPGELMKPLPPRVPEPLEKLPGWAGSDAQEIARLFPAPCRKCSFSCQFLAGSELPQHESSGLGTDAGGGGGFGPGLRERGSSGFASVVVFFFSFLYFSVCYQCASFPHGPSSRCILPKRVPNSSSRLHLLPHFPRTPGAGFLKGFPGPCSP